MVLNTGHWPLGHKFFSRKHVLVRRESFPDRVRQPSEIFPEFCDLVCLGWYLTLGSPSESGIQMPDESRELTAHERARADAEFVRALTDEQLGLLRYVTTLLGDPEAARNVVQETNMVLWQKASDFEVGTNFTAWARKVAYWQTMAFLRDRKRDAHVFSEELVQQLASRTEVSTDELSRRLALRDCMKKLPREQFNVLLQKYEEELSVTEIANRTGKTTSAIKMSLVRSRRWLLQCIEARMAEGELR